MQTHKEAGRMLFELYLALCTALCFISHNVSHSIPASPHTFTGLCCPPQHTFECSGLMVIQLWHMVWIGCNKLAATAGQADLKG